MGIPPRSYPVNTSHVGRGEAGQEEGPLVRRQEQGRALPPPVWRVSPPGSHMRGFAGSCSSLAPTHFLHLLLLFFLPSSHHCCYLCLRLLPCPASRCTPILQGKDCPDLAAEGGEQEIFSREFPGRASQPAGSLSSQPVRPPSVGHYKE